MYDSGIVYDCCILYYVLLDPACVRLAGDLLQLSPRSDQASSRALPTSLARSLLAFSNTVAHLVAGLLLGFQYLGW